MLGQLTRLESQTIKREENAKYLEKNLTGLDGISLMRNDPRVSRRGYHMFIFRILPEKWDGITRNKFLEALKAEGIPAMEGYTTPIYRNPLFLRKGEGPKLCPLSCPYYGKKIDYAKVSCPNTEKICKEAVWIFHTLLLAEKGDMQDIADGILKVWENRKELF